MRRSRPSALVLVASLSILYPPGVVCAPGPRKSTAVCRRLVSEVEEGGLLRGRDGLAAGGGGLTPFLHPGGVGGGRPGKLPALLLGDALALLHDQKVHEARERVPEEADVLLPVAGRVGERAHPVEGQRERAAVALLCRELEVGEDPRLADARGRRADAGHASPPPRSRISYPSRSACGGIAWTVTLRPSDAASRSSPSRPSPSRWRARSGCTRTTTSRPPASSAAATFARTARKISAASVASALMTPLPLQVGHPVERSPRRSWRTRFRVISTRPSSEIWSTLVRALSPASAFLSAFSTCSRCSSCSMSMKSMMMMPPRSRSRIWRTTSPTASRLILSTVWSKSRLPTYLPVFTSIETSASVWSITM